MADRKRSRPVLVLLGTTAALAAGAGIAWVMFPFPVDRLERWPASPLVTARDGTTLLRLVGRDDQWRFPVPLADISPWLVRATKAVEDRRFDLHAGIDARAVARAAVQNLMAARIISGASTITMQVCRMTDDRPRTLAAKLIESFRALQLERIRNKDEILAVYLNTAPYGANLRGAAAASLAYFGKRPADLSLAEAALLAGLPQSPARYRPDRHPEPARRRRDMVLMRMVETGAITQSQRAAAAAEPVVLSRNRPTDLAPHAAWLALQRRLTGGRTTIDPDIQRDVSRLAVEHASALPAGSDVAAVVIDIPSGDIVSLVGSVNANDPIDGQVNGAVARRSPGSALKPFVYAAAFQGRDLNDESVVHDVPIHRAGWSPGNFDGGFMGELTAAEALRRSLNIPAILVAEATGLSRCLGQIEAAGIHLPQDAHERGGLAVVVGAIEVTLLDLVNGYATLGRGGIRRTPRLFVDEATDTAEALDSVTCAMIDDILSSRHRCPRGMAQLDPGDVPWFMWKTGTSSGRRDAWAVGHNRRCAIGVWIGRFSGMGAPAFVGAEAAEPLLGRLFAHPLLRNDTDPAPPHRWPARTVLRRPNDDRGPLQITVPHSGATFVAVNGSSVISPKVNRGNSLTWFLNGSLLASEQASRLVLEPGRYELRCVDDAGQQTAVRFTIVSSYAGS